jgi:hypothetical protein
LKTVKIGLQMLPVFQIYIVTTEVQEGQLQVFGGRIIYVSGRRLPVFLFGGDV